MGDERERRRLALPDHHLDAIFPCCATAPEVPEKGFCHFSEYGFGGGRSVRLGFGSRHKSVQGKIIDTVLCVCMYLTDADLMTFVVGLNVLSPNEPLANLCRTDLIGGSYVN